MVWLLLVFKVVVLAIDGAGVLVVLVVSIVKWLLLCGVQNCDLCKNIRGWLILGGGQLLKI